MAKKVNAVFKASIQLNADKGGGWLASYQAGAVDTEGNSMGVIVYSAWKNPSAAKRWIKERVVAETPRKSIKWEVKATSNEKPSHFAGELTYKVEA
jgi:hypothetical protein